MDGYGKEWVPKGNIILALFAVACEIWHNKKGKTFER